MNEKNDIYEYEDLACYRLGLRSNGGAFTHLSCCPSYGSSDCPITMGEELSGCDCTSDRRMRHIEQVMQMMR